MYQKGDFHIHSTASDGELNPMEVVKLAKDKGVDIMALTDHNTTEGVIDAIKAGKFYGITVIPGVELSTRFNNERIHILGYFSDDRYKSSIFKRVLMHVKSHKVKNVQKLLKKYANMDIKLDEVSGRLSVLSGIEILKFFGAAVVLAHPVLIRKETLNSIINMPFDGIEAKYFKNTKEDTELFINLAKNMGKFYTAGSDFHTNRIRDLKHGSIGDVYLNSEEIDIFLKEAGLLEYLYTYRKINSYNYKRKRCKRIENMYNFYRQMPEVNSYFRMLQASSNTPAVDIYANGNLIVDDFKFKEVTNYVAVPEGSYNIKVFKSGENVNPIINENVIIPADNIFNIAIIGNYPDISLYPLPEPLNPQNFGRPCIRFIGLSPNGPNVDIALPDETVIFNNVGYKDFTQYACILEGRYRFQIRNAGTENVILNTPVFNLSPNNFYSVYILSGENNDANIQTINLLEPRA